MYNYVVISEFYGTKFAELWASSASCWQTNTPNSFKALQGSAIDPRCGLRPHYPYEADFAFQDPSPSRCYT